MHLGYPCLSGKVPARSSIFNEKTCDMRFIVTTGESPRAPPDPGTGTKKTSGPRIKRDPEAATAGKTSLYLASRLTTGFASEATNSSIATHVGDVNPRCLLIMNFL